MMNEKIKRKAISKKTRFEIFKRDSFTCQYCGAHPPQVILQVDHIVPVAEGGGNEHDNLVTSCQPCNIGKGARQLSDVPQSLKDRAKEIAESEEQIKGYNAVMMQKAKRIENESWDIAAALEHKQWVESYDKQNLLSIRRFLERLPFVEVKDAAEITAAKFSRPTNQSFRYFCGVCWGKIREAEQ